MLDKPHSHAKSMLDTPVAERMPREIAPGVFWIGDCLAQRHKGKVYHGYNAAFLVAGETASCLVETGHPKDFPVIERHLNELFARGVRTAQVPVRHPPGDAALRRARPRAQDSSRGSPVSATSATITWRSRNTSTACGG